jgi:hypothetical protein
LLLVTAVDNGKAGAAPPMISSTVLAALLVIQTLPEMSIATPVGAAVVLPWIVETTAPAFDKTVTMPLPVATRIWELPSMARAEAPARPMVL